MGVRYAILGLLNEQPMHGYRLKRVFDQRVSPLWGLTTGQIYQTLTALERAALVESVGRRRHSNRPPRRVYSITSSGKRDLDAWLKSPPRSARPFREEIIVRMMLLGESAVDDLSASLAKSMEDRKILLTQVTRMRGQASNDGQKLDLTGVFLESMTHQLEAELKNLELFRSQLAPYSQ